MTSKQQIRWWGWGDQEKFYPIARQRKLLSFLETRIGSLDEPRRPIAIESIRIPPTCLQREESKEMEEIVGEERMKVDDESRIRYSFGKSYKDLIRLRNGIVELVTDAVVFPDSEAEIEAILKWASNRDISIIPFGGGTSVVGGVERDPSSARAIVVSLERMVRFLGIDETSLTAKFQAGIVGPDLEKALNELGYSLGHFPQSFEFSTLGGWIATRGAGQASTKYGKIEHMLQSVRVVTPTGIVEAGRFPAQAAGGDLLQAIIGSEGILGIITEAVLKIHKLPEICDTRGYVFDDFNGGIEVIRKTIQANVTPAIVRLSDVDETEVSIKLREFEKGSVSWRQKLGKAYLALRGHSPKRACLLIMGFEGTKREVNYERHVAERMIRKNGGISLGKAPGKSWQKRRFEHPYLRDKLVEVGVLVDTLETSTSWSNLQTLYEATNAAFEKSFKSMGTKGLVLTHVSHLYRDGASLYFTFLLPAKRAREIDQWEVIKKEVTDSLIANGGSLSHHHGIGKDHIRWMESFLGKNSLKMLAGMKRQLDPCGVMNPGTLVTFQWRKRPEERLRGEFSSRTRQENIDQLTDEHLDILVIGGGITGAGIAWDAAARGMKVGLIEKGDFGSGTSSKSSKMIHGGLRYLKQLNVKLVKESLHERGLLLKSAPHLVHPTPHVIPVYGSAALRMMELRIGLTGYDILAGSLNIARHEKLTAEEVVERVPSLKKEGLTGGFLYYDCLVNDARLTLNVMLSAARAGAIVANYVEAERIVSENENIVGVEFKDVLTGKSGRIKASVMVSAAGPWTDRVRYLANEKGKRLRLTKGIHLVFERNRLPSDDVVLLFAADSRPLYLVPAGDCCYVGTTDTDYKGDLDDIRATKDDLNYVLKTIRTYFPDQRVGEDDVLGYWAGVRPLVATEGEPSRVSRDYIIDHESSGLVTVAGGKLTTFRSMAEEAVDEIMERYKSKFQRTLGPCQTDSTHMIGGEIENFETYRQAVEANLSGSWEVDGRVIRRLLSVYGTRYLSVLGYGLSDPSLLRPLSPGSDMLMAEILYAVDHEMAVTVEDFMERRAGLKYFSYDHGLPVVNRIARVMGKRLGWSFSERRRQVKRYLKSVETMTRFETDKD